jgi:hypothetical protein
MSGQKAHEKRILKLANQIAATGRHNGWFHIAMELENKRGEPLAQQILEREPHRSQLDKACDAVRRRLYGPPKT